MFIYLLEPSVYITRHFLPLQTAAILKLSEVFPEADGLKRAADATLENYDKIIEQIGREESEEG